jgi:hypothetical protein
VVSTASRCQWPQAPSHCHRTTCPAISSHPTLPTSSRTLGRKHKLPSSTRKQESLGTKIRTEAAALLNARNESIRQPQLNLQIAKAYLAGTDSGVSTRTWRDAFNAIIENKTASTKERWQRGARQKAFDLIHHLIIVETQAEHLFACLKAGTVSTNILLREARGQSDVSDGPVADRSERWSRRLHSVSANRFCTSSNSESSTALAVSASELFSSDV